MANACSSAWARASSRPRDQVGLGDGVGVGDGVGDDGFGDGLGFGDEEVGFGDRLGFGDEEVGSGDGLDDVGAGASGGGTTVTGWLVLCVGVALSAGPGVVAGDCAAADGRCLVCRPAGLGGGLWDAARNAALTPITATTIPVAAATGTGPRASACRMPTAPKPGAACRPADSGGLRNRP